MGNERRGDASSGDWLSSFREAVLAKLPRHLTGGSDHGSLRKFAFDGRDDETWGVATYVMDGHEGTTFMRSRRVAPDLVSKDPEFAADLFCTHLVESFHTEARNLPTDVHGVVRH